MGAFKRLILRIEGTEDKKDLDTNWSTAYMRAFKRLILWIEGTEDKTNLDINWSTAHMGAFKRLILWIEGTEDENDFDINWSTAYMRAFKRLILWIEGTEDKNDLDKNWNGLCGTFKRLMQYNFSVTRVEKVFYFHQTGKAKHKSQKLKQSSFTEFNCRHYQSQFVLLCISLFSLHW